MPVATRTRSKVSKPNVGLAVMRWNSLVAAPLAPAERHITAYWFAVVIDAIETEVESDSVVTLAGPYREIVGALRDRAGVSVSVTEYEYRFARLEVADVAGSVTPEEWAGRLDSVLRAGRAVSARQARSPYFD